MDYEGRLFSEGGWSPVSGPEIGYLVSISGVSYPRCRPSHSLLFARSPERVGLLGSRKTLGVRCVPQKSCREERAVHRRFLDGLVRGTKTVMRRVEVGGTLYLVAVVGVLLTSRKEGSKS